jgi:hypothetical protein
MRIALLDDGALALEVEPAVLPAVEGWIPRFPVHAPPAAGASIVRVEAGPPPPAPEGPPALDLRALRGWIPRGDGRVVLREDSGAVGAEVDLAAGVATVRIADAEAAAGALSVETFGALTISAALLLTRLGRALVHAAAVVAPDGRAWLLAAGTFGGKTTTCVNLIRAGWNWLSDDHVVLGEGADGALRVEGWPRRFNLDHGHGAGAAPCGVRSRVDPERFGPGKWDRHAPLGGLFLPRVEAQLPTRLARVHPAAALGRLVEQAPWLLADPAGAPRVLALFQRAASLSAYELRLGTDVYCDARWLQSLLAVAVNPPNGA